MNKNICCFIFILGSLKWTQIMLRDQIPSRTFHSGHFVSPSILQDSSVKASSVPYLQKKIARLNLERPRSSPGVRLSSSDSKSQRSLSGDNGSLHTECSVSHSSLKNSETKSSCLNDGSKLEKPNVLRLNSENTEILKLDPSPSENTADKSPLCPKQTDINFNGIDTLDRNSVFRGLDNPGISDSTEELIRESYAVRSRSRTESLSENNKVSSVFNRSLSYTTELEKKKLHHRNSESAMSVGYDSHGSLVSDDVLDALCVKKTRLDPELVLEDLEFSDCFPNDVKISYPRHVTLRCSSKSSESLLCDSDKLETIYLDDVSEQKLSKKQQYSVRNGFESVRFDSDKSAVYFLAGVSEKYKNVRNHEISAIREQRMNSNCDNRRSVIDDKRETTQEMETCFEGPALNRYSDNLRSESKKETRLNKV